MKETKNTKPQSGILLLVNGASSTGKSTLSRLVQEKLHAAGHESMLFAADDFLRMSSAKYENVRAGNAAGIALVEAFHAAIATAVNVGALVIADHVLGDAEAWQRDLFERLADNARVFLVQPHCTERCVREREAARNDRTPDVEHALRQMLAVYVVEENALSLDTSESKPQENAQKVLDWFLPQAFPKLDTAAASAVEQNNIPSRPQQKTRNHTPALMFWGTSSNAGKSVLAAAFCRILYEDGYNVAPFKAQNMSLNSGVTANGLEMGRAQIVQAQAAHLDPDVRMNPILLKPHSDTGSQIVRLGTPMGNMNAREYFSRKSELWQTVASAYNSLAAEHEVMVLEGAGSPAEVNLKRSDIVNVRMAEHAKAATLLVGDIDRGGVYASFLGTWHTLTEAEKPLLSGYLVNRFRGDATLLSDAHDYMIRETGVPVLGVVPYMQNIRLPEEDSAAPAWFSLPCTHEISASSDTRPLDVAVVMLRHISNHTDMQALADEPSVRLRPVRRAEEWGNPDVVLLPGSKNVADELAFLHKSGLAEKIIAHAHAQKWVFGICGGLQILGRTLRDPHHVESSASSLEALGLLNIVSTMSATKTLCRVDFAYTPLGVPSSGYEIHHGVTEHGVGVEPAFYVQEDGQNRVCGYASGRVWASYLHGIFDDDTFRHTFMNKVREDCGLRPCTEQDFAVYDVEQSLDALAALVRKSVDMPAIYAAMGLRGAKK